MRIVGRPPETLLQLGRRVRLLPALMDGENAQQKPLVLRLADGHCEFRPKADSPDDPEQRRTATWLVMSIMILGNHWN